MVRLLGLTRFGFDSAAPREITKTNPVGGGGGDDGSGGGGESGWLIRFFDSAFFCEWIAVSYLYKHDHAGVRDYLCNRMYSLPIPGIESYLFQICYMLVHKPSPSLDKFVIDMCAKSLQIALKVHWFLMAELEDVEDNEGISRIQEKCQIAATLMGEWLPLVVHNPAEAAESTPGSSKSHHVLNRLFSSKQRLLSLGGGSPPPLVRKECNGHVTTVSAGNIGIGNDNNDEVESISATNTICNGDDTNNKISSFEDNKLLKKFIPGSKVRDSWLFRKSLDKETEDAVDKEGFFKRFRRDKQEEDADKDGLLRMFLRDSRDKEEESAGKEGFFKRLLSSKGKEEVDETDNTNKDGIFKMFSRESKDREGGENDKDGFLKKFIRDSKEKGGEDSDKHGLFKSLRADSKNTDEELTSSSEGYFKGLFRDKEEKSEHDDEKEGFFKKLFKDKQDEKKEPEFHNKGEEDRGNREDDEKQGFFKRLLKVKQEEKQETETNDAHEEDNDNEEDCGKEGFFKRLFKDKQDEKKESENHNEDDEHKVNREYDEKDGFFKRLLKVKQEEKQEAETSNMVQDDNENAEDKEKDGFFKRLFKDKQEEKDEAETSNAGEVDKSNGQDDEKDGFFKRLFKDKSEEKKQTEQSNAEKEDKGNITYEEEENMNFFRGLFRVHPEETKTSITTEKGGNVISAESSPGTESFFRRLFRDREKSIEDSELLAPKKNIERHPGSLWEHNENFSRPPLPSMSISQIRKGTYHVSLEFVQSLCDTSYGLVDIFPAEDRKSALVESLAEINSHIADAQENGGVCFPMGKGMYQVVHIPEEEAILLNSREKAPYLICVEVLKGEGSSRSKESSYSQKLSRGGIPLANGDAQLPKPPPWAYPLWNKRDIDHDRTDRMLKSTSEAIDQAMTHLWEAKIKFVHVNLSVETQTFDRSNGNAEADPPQGIQNSSSVSTRSSPCNIVNESNTCQFSGVDSYCESEWVNVRLSAVPGVNMDDVDDQQPLRKKEHRRVPSTIAIEEVKAAAAKGHAPPGLPLKGSGQDSSDTHPTLSSNGVPKPTDALSGELWEVKKERIRRSSVFGKSPGWDLRSVIVKSGDDCRQEHLAVQLISHFYDIFQEAGLPLWLRPYEVLVTSSYTALIETIPDTASLHSIKSRFPSITSLREFFIAKYEENSQILNLLRNFVESMAGYSLLCYLLQVKDRHNGNLLMDEEGHIIHIDFGFMLSNSPGGVNFESAPFKLTRELLEVMDSDAEGNPSEFFDYFKVLCIQGFLTCRKHAERIILLVEMLQDSGFPCFKGGPRAIQNLRKRFHLSLTEEQCVSLVLSLISSSLDAWRTRQYDYYQRVLLDRDCVVSIPSLIFEKRVLAALWSNRKLTF